jgi:hypothetical protein
MGQVQRATAPGKPPRRKMRRDPFGDLTPAEALQWIDTLTPESVTQRLEILEAWKQDAQNHLQQLKQDIAAWQEIGRRLAARALMPSATCVALDELPVSDVPGPPPPRTEFDPGDGSPETMLYTPREARELGAEMPLLLSRRIRIYDYLRKAGPSHRESVAQRLGVLVDEAAQCLCCTWFEDLGGGLYEAIPFC